MNQTISNRINQINSGHVPEGYEKSSFGVFPVDWEKRKILKSLGSFSKGKGLPGTALINEGVPCIGYGDIYMKYNIHFNKAKSFVDEDTAKESQPIDKGTLLFTGTGETALEIGKCVCYNGNETIYAGGDILLFNSNKVNPLFLAYQQNIESAIKQKAKYGQGHSVVHIQINNLEKLNVAYPKSQTEQAKIAEILMKWDEAIEAQEQLINKLEIRKKALMQKLLTPKEGWEKVKIGDLGSIITGNTPPTSKVEYYNGDILWVTPTDISNKYTEEVERYLTPKGAKVARILPKGSILITCIASIGKNTILKKEGSCNQQINAVIVNHLYDNEFIYYLLELFSKRMVLLAGKSATPIISKGLFEKMKIYIPYKDRQPDLKEQNRIANILSLSDEEIVLYKQKLDKLKEQRKSLMQLLLTGIVRVVA